MASTARRCLASAALYLCSLGAALALVVYGNGATWERELPPCASERSACTLVHRRYWLSPLEIRLCRCPRKEPCPGGFDTTPDGSALNVTSRTQLKMCAGWQAPACNASQVSLVTKVIRRLGHAAQANDTKQTHADVICRCSGQDTGVHYRRAHGNNSADSTHYERRQYFTCESVWSHAVHILTPGHAVSVQLPDCKPEEPCGHVTRDFYALYRTCTCPPSNLCTVPMNFSDRRLVNVREALYEGTAYLALCQPY